MDFRPEENKKIQGFFNVSLKMIGNYWLLGQHNYWVDMTLFCAVPTGFQNVCICVQKKKRSGGECLEYYQRSFG